MKNVNNETMQLIGFLAVWAALAYLIYKQYKSFVTSIGGGLIASIFVVLGGSKLIERVQPIPQTLADAQLEGRLWAPNEVMLARKVTHRQLSSLADALDDADRRGDAQLIWSIMPESTKVLRAWNEQSEATKSEGHNCTLAALSISNGLSTVAGRSGWDRPRFDAALQACKP